MNWFSVTEAKTKIKINIKINYKDIKLFYEISQAAQWAALL